MAAPTKIKANDSMDFKNKPVLVAIIGRIVGKSELSTVTFEGSYVKDKFNGTFAHGEEGNCESGGIFEDSNAFVNELSNVALEIEYKHKTVAITQKYSFSGATTLKALVLDGDELVEIDFAKSANRLITFVEQITNFDFSVGIVLQDAMQALDILTDAAPTVEKVAEPANDESQELVDAAPDTSLEVPELNDFGTFDDGIDDSDEQQANGLTSVITQAKGHITISTGDGENDYHVYSFDPDEESAIRTHSDETEEEVSYGEALEDLVLAYEQEQTDVIIEFPFQLQVLGTRKAFKAKTKKERKAETIKVMKLISSTMVGTHVVRPVMLPQPNLEDVKQLTASYVRQLRSRVSQPLGTALTNAFLIGTAVDSKNTVVFQGDHALVLNKGGKHSTTLEDAIKTLDLDETAFQVDHRILADADDLKDSGYNVYKDSIGILMGRADNTDNLVYVTSPDALRHEIRSSVDDVTNEVEVEVKSFDNFIETTLTQPVAELVADLSKREGSVDEEDGDGAKSQED